MPVYNVLPTPATGNKWHDPIYSAANCYDFEDFNAIAGAPLVLAPDILYAVPIYIPRRMTIDRLGVNINPGEAGKSIRIGIYRGDGVLGVAGTRLLDSGEISIAASGVKLASINITLQQGEHWCALITNCSAVTCNVITTAIMASRLGTSITDLNVVYAGVSGAQAYGALPNPCPALTTDVKRINFKVRVTALL